MANYGLNSLLSTRVRLDVQGVDDGDAAKHGEARSTKFVRDHYTHKFLSIMCCAQDAEPAATITCTMDRQRPRVPTKNPNSSIWPVPRPVRRGLQDLLVVTFVHPHWRNIWWIYWKPGEFLSIYWNVFLFFFLSKWLYRFRFFQSTVVGVKRLFSMLVSSYLFFYASIFKISLSVYGAVVLSPHFDISRLLGSFV